MWTFKKFYNYRDLWRSIWMPLPMITDGIMTVLRGLITRRVQSGTMIIIIILYLLLMLPERKKLLITNTYLDIKYNCFVESPKIVQVAYIGCTSSRMLERNYWHIPRIFFSADTPGRFFDYRFFESTFQTKTNRFYLRSHTVTESREIS